MNLDFPGQRRVVYALSKDLSLGISGGGSDAPETSVPPSFEISQLWVGLEATERRPPNNTAVWKMSLICPT